MPPRATSARRFTLIELLVVVAIIAILAAMLLPSLQKARGTARRMVCGTNMKQLTTALQLYFEDFDQHQPLFATYQVTAGCIAQEYLYFVALAGYSGVSGVDKQPMQGGPGGRMWAYVAGVADNGPIRRSVWFCPDDSAQLGTWVTPATLLYGTYTNYGPSYFRWDPSVIRSANPTTKDGYIPTCGAGGNFETAPDLYLGKYLARSPNADRAGVFAHTYGRGCYLMVARVTGGWIDYSYNRTMSHNNNLPTSFLDGHVEFITWDAMGDPASYGPASPTPLWFLWTW